MRYVCVAGLLLLAGCGTSNEPKLPDKVFVYVTCTVNKSYLTPELAPTLSSLAERSVVFDRHRSEAGASGIAQASIFTSMHSAEHGVFYQPDTIDPEIYDVSEALADLGYRVHFFDGHRMSKRDLGYLQASDDAASGRITPAELYPLISAEGKVAIFSVHTMTHAPYSTHGWELFKHGHPDFYKLDRERAAELIEYFYDNMRELRYFNAHREMSEEDLKDLVVVVDTLYRLNIRRLDNYVAALLRQVPEDCLFVFTSDHGESMFEEGAECQWCHGARLTDNVIEVPMIWSHPDFEAQRVTKITRSIDVAPTLVGLLGGEPHPTWTGADLSAAVRGESAVPDLISFSHKSFRQADPDYIPDFSVHTNDSSLVLQSDGTLVGDPALAEMLQEYFERTIVAHRMNVESIPMEDAMEILESMGYIH